MNKPENLFCRICGFEYPGDHPAWEDDETPSYDICICCGAEFGYEDANYEAVKAYRKRWLDEGAHWYLPGKRPADWNVNEQLKQIPEKWK